MPINVNLGRKVKNRHKVPLKMWNRWSNHARRVFNYLMNELRQSRQSLLVHPHAAIMHKDHWQTIRWNASWLAANGANGEKRMSKIIKVHPKKRKKK